MAVLAVTVTVGTAASQELHVGLHGGVAIPAGDFYEPPVALSTGGAVGVVINLNSTQKPYGVALSMNYSSMRSDADAVGYVETWAIAGSFVWWPGKVGKTLRPWLQAGVGVDYWQVRPLNSIALAAEAGAGAALDLGGSVLPYVESRYHVTLTDGDNLRQVLVLAGLRYRL